MSKPSLICAFIYLYLFSYVCGNSCKELGFDQDTLECTTCDKVEFFTHDAGKILFFNNHVDFVDQLLNG